MKSICNAIVLCLLILLVQEFESKKFTKSKVVTKGGLTEWFMLVFQHSEKCLDESAASLGGNVHQWDCHGGNNQRWRIHWNDDGTATFFTKSTGRVLDVAWSGTHNGGNIHAWDYNGSGAQRFYMMSTDTGHMMLKNKTSGKCIDVNAGSHDNSANIHQWDCHWGANQRIGFILVEAS